MKATPAESTLSTRAATFESMAAKLAAARSVLIIGGGPVGVELAGEIVSKTPGKRVTLVDGGSALLSLGMPPAAGSIALSWLRASGVRVLLNTKVGGGEGGVLLNCSAPGGH